MVLSVEKLFSRLFGKEDVRILMMGPDAAGKTTILDMIRHGEIVMPTTPTINCNVKTLEYNNISFSVWDAYGQDKKHYFHGTHGLIFVVDCNDHDRIMEAKDELHLMLKKADLRDAMLLICANNQALPNAMDNTMIIDKLELYSLHQQGWYIQSTSASSEDGIYEGLDWLSKKIAYISTAEVIIDVDHLGYLWAPATFINENQNGTLQMKFVRERNNFKKKTSLETYNSLGGGIEDISLSRIRPSPPDFGLRVYSLFEKVEVHLESGWCPGVVTKICFGRKYYARFGRDNQIMYFDYWQVRPCREWKDRFWLTNEENGLGSEQNPHAVEGGMEDLIHLLFFGFLFTREDERDWCAIDSLPLNRSDYLQSISEFKSISLLSQLLYQSFVPDKKEALKCCIKHAKLWLANSDQLVNYSNCRVSYARLKNKLKKIMESPYFISAEMTVYTGLFMEKVVVFWDFENAHVPRGQDPSEIFENIISALKKLNLNGDVEMVGIGDTNIIKKHLDTLKKSGITFMHVSGGKNNAANEKIIVEMSFWAYNHLEVHYAPGSILLITGDTNYFPIIQQLQERGFNMLVAHHKDTHKKLRKVANRGWLWKDLVKGEIAEALIEAQTKRQSPKSLGSH